MSSLTLRLPLLLLPNGFACIGRVDGARAENGRAAADVADILAAVLLLFASTSKAGSERSSDTVEATATRTPLSTSFESSLSRNGHASNAACCFSPLLLPPPPLPAALAAALPGRRSSERERRGAKGTPSRRSRTVPAVAARTEDAEEDTAEEGKDDAEVEERDRKEASLVLRDRALLAAVDGKLLCGEKVAKGGDGDEDEAGALAHELDRLLPLTIEFERLSACMSILSL